LKILYPVSLNLLERPCVVIGNDREALEKEAALREAGASVTWIKDAAQLRDDDVTGAFFVISTPQDEALSARLRALADTHRFLLCCIDQPKFGFVAMAAIVKAGPVRIAISTAGLAPRIGKLIKESLQRVFDKKFERFIEHQAAAKEANRERYPDSLQKRRDAMIALADGFELHASLTYPDWFENTCHPEQSLPRAGRGVEGPHA
jgi:precorrin-2 dehydrogenase/sirohydrochlorin ferrochelatase